MNANDIQHFKTKLTEEKALLERELNSVGSQGNNEGNSVKDWVAKSDDMDIIPADENEVADELESFQNNQAMVGSLEQRYRQVTAALEAIEKGTYGTCKVDGSPIERDRLEANPAADTCKAHMN